MSCHVMLCVCVRVRVCLPACLHVCSFISVADQTTITQEWEHVGVYVKRSLCDAYRFLKSQMFLDGLTSQSSF